MGGVSMRCPRCGFEGELVHGGCARCGYGRASTSSDSWNAAGRTSLKFANQYSLAANPTAVQSLMRGDVLRQGRYRMVEQALLPENQQGQGAALLATDTQSAMSRVLIREVLFPDGVSEHKEQVVRSIALRLSELAQHPGFPRVIDMFSERGSYYLVFQYPEGETLGTLLKRQGGALPERMVAEFGRQLCEMLLHLSHQQPPLVLGSINPDSIMVSPDKKRVSLMYLPLFPLKAQPTHKGNASAGYLAPEQVRGGSVE